MSSSSSSCKTKSVAPPSGASSSSASSSNVDLRNAATHLGVQRTVVDLQAALVSVDPARDAGGAERASQLLALAKRMLKPEHLDEVAEERHAEDLCGWPCCSRRTKATASSSRGGHGQPR